MLRPVEVGGARRGRRAGVIPWPYMTPSVDQPAQASAADPPPSGSAERSESWRCPCSSSGTATRDAGVSPGAASGRRGSSPSGTGLAGSTGTMSGGSGSCAGLWAAARATMRAAASMSESFRAAHCSRAWARAALRGREPAAARAAQRLSGPLTPPAPAAYQEAPIAQVAELVDAPDSGSGGLKTVEVRILSWASRRAGGAPPPARRVFARRAPRVCRPDARTAGLPRSALTSPPVCIFMHSHG